MISNNILDSLKAYELFTLKDEAQIEQCVRIIEETVNGQKLIGRSATSDITDGLQTLFIFYSKNKYRFVSYHELYTAKDWCPEFAEWKKAVKARNLVKLLFEKYQRQGTWRRQGMIW
jgi:hypothetical protein